MTTQLERAIRFKALHERAGAFVVLFQKPRLGYNPPFTLFSLSLLGRFMKRTSSPFKWRHYAPDVILLCVRRYRRYSLSLGALSKR
jgi:hypothetical protein